MYFLLALIDWLSPKPRGSRRVAHGLAYGPDPRHVLDIYAPTASGGPWPVVYFLYGGAWRDGERGYYAFAARRLAAAGFVVVVPDYRLVPQVEYPVFLEDAALGFAFMLDAAASYGADPQRVALMGHSAGAYNAAMLLMHPRLLPAMGLAGRVQALVGLSGPYDFYPFDVPISLRVFGAVDEPKATQPVNLVRSDLPPVFLGTGDKDRLVYPRNSVALAARLREAGIVTVERHYPGVGHPGTLLSLGAFGREGPVLADVVAFLRAHLEAVAGRSPRP